MQKKAILIALVVVGLTSATALAVAAPPADSVAEGASARECSTAGSVAAAEWSSDLLAGTVVAPEAAAPAPPPCPVDRDCTGPAGNGNTCMTNPANCHVAGPGTVTDTGQRACTLPSGHYFVCGGGATIVIKSAPCTQCPCCSQFPACLCPLNCGQVVRWGCA